MLSFVPDVALLMVRSLWQCVLCAVFVGGFAPSRRDPVVRASLLKSVRISIDVEVAAPRKLREAVFSNDRTAMPRGHGFLGCDDVVLADAQFSATGDVPRTVAYVRAGPRALLSIAGPRAVIAVVTCGGLCPGLNAVVQETARCLRTQYGVKSVLGVSGGYAGLAAGRFAELTTESLYASGGTALGTSRGVQPPERMADALEAAGVDAVVIVGGDGTIRGALALSVELRRRGLTVGVAVVPKTIDNDIPLIDRSFGFVRKKRRS